MIPVSICLTTYNRAGEVSNTIDSLLAQSFGDFELLISDDCSSDATEQVCRSYAVKDRRIKYFRNSKNLKMPNNLNAAIQRATGAYIANVHDGDIYRKDLIAKWKQGLDECPDAPFVFNAYDAIAPDGSHKFLVESFESCIPGEYIALHFFRTLTSCVWGTVMARAEAYARAGLFDPSFGFISDVDMWLRLARDSRVAYVPEPLISVIPRETSHPYYYVSWQHEFWLFGIYARHLRYYEDRFGSEKFAYAFSRHQTARGRLIRDMLSLVKHRQWARVKEGLGIWRDAKDPLLSWIGYLLGTDRWKPAWYDPGNWEPICSLDS